VTMTAVLQNVIPFLLVITLIVTVHELGHFLVARAFGVAVDRFSIGFGRALVSWRDRAGVEWRIAWLPLGGYVRFAGDENIASVPDQKDLAVMRTAIVAKEGPGAERKYLHFKPLWQRAAIVVAGPVANFLLSIFLFGIVILSFGVAVSTSRIHAVVAGSAAASAGFKPQDVVVRADQKPISGFEDLQFYTQSRALKPIAFTVERAGRLVQLTATPGAKQTSSPFGGSQTIGVLGLESDPARVEHVGPVRAFALATVRTWAVAVDTLDYLGRLVTGQVDANQLHSWLGIAHASGAFTRQAILVSHDEQPGVVIANIAGALISFSALLSVSVGLLNLLPIPVLDGGHLIFYAYEWVARRPPRASVQAAGYRVGLALLVGLMLFATFNDLRQLRVIHFLLGSLFS
jgi:regulator of sigma E protease